MKLIIFFAVISALLAVAGSIYVGIETFDGTVTEHPYEEGLAWDKTQRERTALGWRVHIENRKLFTGENDMVISLNDTYGTPLAGCRVSLTAGRPGTSAHDTYFDAAALEDGRYRSRVRFPHYGYWNVRIDVTRQGRTASYTKRLYVEKGEAVYGYKEHQ